MVNLMEKKNYDLTQITQLLLEMRENCALRKEGEAYDDPKRMEKYDALNAAIDLINNPSLLVTGDTSDGYHTFNEWISVEERLPENEDLVLVRANGRAMEIRWEGTYVLASYSSEGWSLWDYEDDEVKYLEILHWMPLPKAPEEEG